MLSVDAQKILSDNGYSVYNRNRLCTISNAKKPVGVHLFLLGIILAAIPVLLIYTNPITSLAVGLLAIYPAYVILKSTEVPNSITIDLGDQTINLLSINGVKSKSIGFKEITKLGIRCIEETGDANAFKDNHVKVIYYLSIVTNSKAFDVFKLENVNGGMLKTLKEDLSGIIYHDTQPVLEPVAPEVQLVHS